MHIRHWRRTARRLSWITALVAALVAGPALAVCSAPGAADAMGSFSPAALKGNGGSPSVSASPLVPGFSGFKCSDQSLLKLSLVNYLKGTISAGTVLRLSSTTTTDFIPFTVAAKSDGSSLLTVGSPFTSAGSRSTCSAWAAAAR